VDLKEAMRVLLAVGVVVSLLIAAHGVRELFTSRTATPGPPGPARSARSGLASVVQGAGLAVIAGVLSLYGERAPHLLVPYVLLGVGTALSIVGALLRPRRG